MIGWLSGIVRVKRPPVAVIDVNGVGYELEAPMSTFGILPAIGGSVELHTHLVVRDDAHALYAFATENERDVFRMLLKVNGVGAKLALAILSGMNVDELSRAVSEGDTVSLSRLPGIGKKTAERLIIDLRDRLAKTDGVSFSPVAGGVAQPSDPAAEAVSALIALGFKPPEASKRVAALETDGMVCEDIVREALRASAA